MAAQPGVTIDEFPDYEPPEDGGIDPEQIERELSNSPLVRRVEP